MGLINGNDNQVTINVHDIVPPENIATIDMDGAVGNTYTKAQFDQSFNEKSEEIDTKIDNIQQIVESDFRGTINPSDATPTEDGTYKPEISSEDDKPTDPNSTADWGKLYPNAGNLRAKSGYETIFVKKGSVWKRAESKIPGVELSPVFDPTIETEAQGGKQIADRYDKILNALDYYFKSYEKVPPKGGDWTNNILKNDNTKETTGLPFVTAINIPTNGAESLYIRIVRFSTTSQYLSQYSSILGKKSDGSIVVLLQGKLNSLPKVFEEFTINVKDYTNISICYDIVDTNNPEQYRPTIILSKSVDQQNSVKAYIDAGDAVNAKNIYNNFIKSVTINIDSFTGTDDERIEKAITMAQNVSGAEIYFPNRQINITKAILIVGNVKYKISGQIQMANNIHDNIFRPKNLVVNPVAPNDKCLSASWTENFEMEFLTGSSIRQSIVPLHTGGQYGWRGICALFVRCRNYKVSGLKVIESHMWSVSNEFCENGEFYNLTFDNTLYVNADGLNIRNGCKNIYAKTLRGRCTDNAVATTVLDATIPSAADAYTGYSYQALGWTYGDFNGAENIIVEDCQVQAQYGQGLIITSGFVVKNITYKDFINSTPSANDWDNVAVCGNQYRGIIYGTSFVVGNLTNVNIINSQSTIHQYSLGVYGQKINNLWAIGTVGAIKNDTPTVINPV